MKAVVPRGAAFCAALLLGLQAVARDNLSPPPDADLTKPAPIPRSSAPPAPHPLAQANCAGAGWQTFTAPKFESRTACEAWVREKLHPGETREFVFPQHQVSGGVNLRMALPFRV